MTRSFLTASLLVLSATLSYGCSHSMIVSRPSDQGVDAAYTQQFRTGLVEHAEDGDIVLRRGYAVLSDMITIVTGGPDMSHAAIYDARTRTVIEAVDGGVKETNLEDFVSGAHRVMVVRPAGARWTERRAAVEKARAAIGTPFDYSGFVGIDNPEKFYCSELVAWAYDQRGKGLIAPGELADLGATIYDSGERGEAPLQRDRVASTR